MKTQTLEDLKKEENEENNEQNNNKLCVSRTRYDIVECFYSCVKTNNELIHFKPSTYTKYISDLAYSIRLNLCLMNTLAKTFPTVSYAISNYIDNIRYYNKRLSNLKTMITNVTLYETFFSISDFMLFIRLYLQKISFPILPNWDDCKLDYIDEDSLPF